MIGNGGLDQPVEVLETVTDREKFSVMVGNDR